MSPTDNYQAALAKLREVLAEARTGDPIFSQLIEARDEVLSRFKETFAAANLPNLTEEEFRAFLRFKNNHHWTGLERQGPHICSDMARLREALALLQDERKPLSERLDTIVQKVRGMGKAIITAILIVLYPDRFGVWNNLSEGGLKKLDFWPRFSRGTPFGAKYEQMNKNLNRLAAGLQIDLWTLDALFWRLEVPEEQDTARGEEKVEESEAKYPERSFASEQRFGLERHLQEFLRDNWDATEIGKKWALYEEPGDPEAGYEYPCGVGRIDLLARHRSEPRWLVVELKREQSSDVTVGQILRYMGWVRMHMAEPNEAIEGLIIAHRGDDTMAYALQAAPGVELLLYEVEFVLHEPPHPWK